MASIAPTVFLRSQIFMTSFFEFVYKHYVYYILIINLIEIFPMSFNLLPCSWLIVQLIYFAHTALFYSVKLFLFLKSTFFKILSKHFVHHLMKHKTLLIISFHKEKNWTKTKTITKQNKMSAQKCHVLRFYFVKHEYS